MGNANHKNRSFLYGDGFFETMRIYKNDIPLWDYHMARAKSTAEFLECSWSIDSESLKTNILNQNTEAHEVVRLSFFRIGGGTYTPEGSELDCDYIYRGNKSPNTRFVLSTDDFNNAVQEIETTDIGLYTEISKPCNSLSGIKSTSALFYVKAGLYLKKQDGIQDLLLINEHGRVCEGLSSNVLILKNGDWIAVPDSEGPVLGVYQRFLQDLISIKKEQISIDDLYQSDMALFTNAATGIKKVKLIR
jgi:branched-chain amino acid aminotransferase